MTAAQGPSALGELWQRGVPCQTIRSPSRPTQHSAPVNDRSREGTPITSRVMHESVRDSEESRCTWSSWRCGRGSSFVTIRRSRKNSASDPGACLVGSGATSRPKGPEWWSLSILRAGRSSRPGEPPSEAGRYADEVRGGVMMARIALGDAGPEQHSVGRAGSSGRDRNEISKKPSRCRDRHEWTDTSRDS